MVLPSHLHSLLAAERVAEREGAARHPGRVPFLRLSPSRRRRTLAVRRRPRAAGCQAG